MKLKQVLYAAILAGLLVSLGALPAGIQPALADDPTTMWVHRARLAYTGRSSHGPDAMVAFIHIRDANLEMVPGATVSAEWTFPDGTTLLDAAVTNEQGIAILSLWEGRGQYQICVLDVTRAGWLYDASLDREGCAVFTLP